MSNIPEIDAHTLHVEMASDEAPFLLDVREEKEFAVAKIPGATLIPLGQLPQRLGEVPIDRPVVLYCHHGRRSAQATERLLQHGFHDVRNLAGGIDQWAVQIDPAMARY